VHDRVTRHPLTARRSDASRMSTEFDAEAYAKAAAAAAGLPLDPRHLPGVVMNLKLAARMAAVVEGLALSPTDEPAPVFVAGRQPPA
jgi:hypothetical protein